MADETSCQTSSAQAICNLPEDERRERIAMLRRELLPRVQRSEPLPDDAGVALEFEPSPEIQQQLDDLVEFERQCCGGLDWGVEARADVLRLTIEGVAPDSQFFRTLGVPPRSEGWHGRVREGAARFAKAGGLGVSAAFLLFCVVPIGIAAVGGASLAAWLGPLDHPAVVLVGGLALGVPAWRYLRRRESASADG